MVKEFKFLATNEIKWKSANGVHIPLSQIHTGHIQNIMKCLVGLGSMEIPENYLGRCKVEWYDIFLTELKRRRNA